MNDSTEEVETVHTDQSTTSSYRNSHVLGQSRTPCLLQIGKAIVTQAPKITYSFGLGMLPESFKFYITQTEEQAFGVCGKRSAESMDQLSMDI
jgi:hypothetical protein